MVREKKEMKKTESIKKNAFCPIAHTGQSTMPVNYYAVVCLSFFCSSFIHFALVLSPRHLIKLQWVRTFHAERLSFSYICAHCAVRFRLHLHWLLLHLLQAPQQSRIHTNTLVSTEYKHSLVSQYCTVYTPSAFLASWMKKFGFPVWCECENWLKHTMFNWMTTHCISMCDGISFRNY